MVPSSNKTTNPMKLEQDESVDPQELPNFSASSPLDINDYDPAGHGRANTTGWPRHPLPYETVYAKRKR